MLARHTLLLADDSLTVQKVVSLTFADEGMQVLTASGGEEALAALGETVPDVLLADVHMPAPNGYELCARVKRDPRTSHVPVLLLVGTFEPFDEAEARRVGADGVLTKPFQSIRDLVNKVGGLIGGHPEQSRDADARADAAGVAADAPAAVEAERESPSPAEDLRPSPAFAGFDADDESIETVPADDYVAAGRARAEDVAAEFVAAEAPFARAAAGRVQEVNRVETATSIMETPSFSTAAAGRGAGGYGAARFDAPPPDPGFDARPPQPATDDSLLELDDLSSHQSSAGADLDDLILDIGDEEDVIGTPVSAPAGSSDSADMFGTVQVEDEPSAGPPAAGEISPANLSSAWSDAPHIEVPPARVTFTEPVVEESAAPEAVEPEFEAWDESAASAESVAAPVGVETEDAPSAVERSAPAAEVAHSEVEDTRTDVAEAAAGAGQFSPELVDAVARRVVELMSDRALREIAWEVVPDLAERLIRERLEKEDTRTR
ncbi:MAG TPA: response regulator [Pyrinomonadaceae bacterium]|nr:response regulator [Pyrinomonadaceae bacterium]